MADAPDHLPLATEFPAATEEQWRKLVEEVLKGASFEDRLQSRSADGLTIEPLYARAPGARRVGRAARRWRVMQRIDHPDPDACNAEALHDLDHGTDGLMLVPAGAIGAGDYGLPPSGDVIARALAGIHLDAGIAIEFEFSPYAIEVPLALAALVERQRVNPTATNIRVGLDPLGALARHGSLPESWDHTSQYIASIAADLAKRGFSGAFATADGRVIHNAAGSEAQELAFVLASAVAYLRAFEGGGIALDAARRMIAFRLTADTDQFLTVAKFRALRKLWTRIEESCGLSPAPTFITAETAWRTMTRDDPYVNILRATIAVFSAGVGGADAITVLPFTAARGLADRFARRVARNTQLVLLEEAAIARVADPTAGTGWSEDLTDKLCRTAWVLFQQIEAAGGAAAALERGLIQQKVKAVRMRREHALAEKKAALIGASEYPAMADVAVLDVPPARLPKLPAAVTCEPLIPVRLAAPFEGAEEA